MKKKVPKKETQMEKLTSGYEQFIKGKKTVNNGKVLFDATLKKAIKPRGSK